MRKGDFKELLRVFGKIEEEVVKDVDDWAFMFRRMLG